MPPFEEDKIQYEKFKKFAVTLAQAPLYSYENDEMGDWEVWCEFCSAEQSETVFGKRTRGTDKHDENCPIIEARKFCDIQGWEYEIDKTRER